TSALTCWVLGDIIYIEVATPREVQDSVDPADLAMRGTRFGRYTLLRRLAVGGMAELFLAQASGVEGFAKVVALKRILPQLAANADFVRMFLHEAKLVANLDHPNIAQVYDIGQSA